MEALVPAFLLAALSQFVDRSALLSAILSDRFSRPATIAIAVSFLHCLANFIAAGAALAVIPMLTPNAQSLLIAIALVVGGLGLFWNRAEPRRFDGWRLPPLPLAFVGALLLGFGDRIQFFTFALASKGQPWFAAAGAAIGASIPIVAAAYLGERSWRRLPIRWIRFALATIFLLIGIYIALGALRLR